MKKLIGYAMIASVFIVMFIGCVASNGFWNALAMFGGTFFIIGFLYVGISLICSD